VRNAPKSTLPSSLNGVISATNEPSIFIFDMASQNPALRIRDNP
jgi:hypothetical protein